jgi:hypothetical protein
MKAMTTPYLFWSRMTGRREVVLVRLDLAQGRCSADRFDTTMLGVPKDVAWTPDGWALIVGTNDVDTFAFVGRPGAGAQRLPITLPVPGQVIRETSAVQVAP